MEKWRESGFGERGVTSLICAGLVLFGSMLPLSAQVADSTAEKPKDILSANGVASLDDLAGRFLDVQSGYQSVTPPFADFILRQDGGMLVFDPNAFPESFSKALVGMMEYDCPVYTVTGIEDPASREVIFLNTDGEKIASVAEASGYDPWWMLNRYHPDLHTGRYNQQEIKDLMAAFDPSRIHITWKLLPVGYAEKYNQAVAEVRAQHVATFLKEGSGVTPMMRYQGSGMTNLEIIALAMAANGMQLTLAYPDDYTNRVDFFTCPDLIANWWDLAVDATNVNTSTNWIAWLDTGALSQSLRFYVAGNADLDSDSDGLADARELYLYHTSPTNSDTDADGLSDYYEIMTLNTDPTNPKTNKPNVQISYPANESRKVWLP